MPDALFWTIAQVGLLGGISITLLFLVLYYGWMALSAGFNRLNRPLRRRRRARMRQDRWR